MAKAGQVHIALLRGINVGGKHKLPMKLLVELFERAGARNVRTYIQSGNVLFEAGAREVGRIAKQVAADIVTECGFESPVITRSVKELEAVLAGNPFPGAEEDEKLLGVAFLEGKPSRTAVAELDPDRSPPDAFEVRGKEIYLHCPNGAARSKLTNAYFDCVLKTTSTVRNWRTTRKLLDLALAPS